MSFRSTGNIPGNGTATPGEAQLVRGKEVFQLHLGFGTFTTFSTLFFYVLLKNKVCFFGKIGKVEEKDSRRQKESKEMKLNGWVSGI